MDKHNFTSSYYFLILLFYNGCVEDTNIVLEEVVQPRLPALSFKNFTFNLERKKTLTVIIWWQLEKTSQKIKNKTET